MTRVSQDMLRRSLAASVAKSPEFSYLVPQLSHRWEHCFDFLRQALMCTADVTLENLEKAADGKTLLASVNGGQHTCVGISELCLNGQLLIEQQMMGVLIFSSSRVESKVATST